MRHLPRIKSDRLLGVPDNMVRPWRIALFIVFALFCSAGLGRPVHTLTMSPPTEASSGSGTAPSLATVALAQDAPSQVASESSPSGDTWTSEDWREWEAQVPRVAAPPDVAAGEPLRVEVVALGSTGCGMPDASVEITWILPNGQFQDDVTTGMFGQAVATRTLASSCRGKRCVVAVSVSRDGAYAQAYSVFVPN